MKRVCLFCGSSPGVRTIYCEIAAQMGAALATRGIGLVYGGGDVGVMGAAAHGALGRGGEVIGVIPMNLFDKEVKHRAVADIRIVDSMHERKALMAELSEAFIALPGGFGTLEEFFEVLTWGQLGLHKKPCALLNVENFFDPLLVLLDHAVAEGFVKEAHRSLVLVENDVERLLDKMAAWHPPIVNRWLEPSQI